MNRIFPCGPFMVSSASEPGVHLRVDGFHAPLLGGPFPNRLQPDWFVLRQAGIRHLVCLASTQPELRYDPYLAGLTWLAKEDMPELADLMEPSGPEGILLRDLRVDHDDEAYKARSEAREKLQQIARNMLAALWRGEGVFVHCEYGVERTGALLALVLALGGVDKEVVARSIARGLSPQSNRSNDLKERLENVLSEMFNDFKFLE